MSPWVVSTWGICRYSEPERAGRSIANWTAPWSLLLQADWRIQAIPFADTLRTTRTFLGHRGTPKSPKVLKPMLLPGESDKGMSFWLCLGFLRSLAHFHTFQGLSKTQKHRRRRRDICDHRAFLQGLLEEARLHLRVRVYDFDVLGPGSNYSGNWSSSTPLAAMEFHLSLFWIGHDETICGSVGCDFKVVFS